MPTNTNSHPNAAGVAALMEKIHHQHAMGGTVRIPVADWLTIYNAMTSDREKYAQSIGAAQTNSARSESAPIVDAEAKRWGDRLNWIHLRYEVDGSGTESGDPLDVIEAEIKQALTREGAEQVTAFANAVLHGDDKHKAWLREAAQCFIDGRPLPEKS